MNPLRVILILVCAIAGLAAGVPAGIFVGDVMQLGYNAGLWALIACGGCGGVIGGLLR